MNATTPSPDDTAHELRVLAATAAPGVRARPDLARVVLHRSGRQRRVRRLRNLLLALGGGTAAVATLAAGVLLGRSDFFTVTQPSGVMATTVQIGERVVFDRTLTPARGDVVLVRVSRDGQEWDTMLRVVGLPGDNVSCPAGPSGDCAALLVNGLPVAEPYLGGTVTVPFAASTVPADRLFLLGDNREAANDSRFIGALPIADVTGVAVRIRHHDGQVREIPGAPLHAGPGDTDNIDPPGPIPPAQATPAD